MMLEDLFARAGQTQAFLALMGCGFLLGALMHGSSMLRRRSRILGDGMDLGCCVLLAMMLLHLLHTLGSGMRAYGALGLCVGALLYAAILSRLVDAAAHAGGKLLKRLQKTTGTKEGFSTGDDESLRKGDPP